MTAPVTRTARIDTQALVDCDGCSYPVEVDDDEARGCGPVWCLLCRAMGLADSHEEKDETAARVAARRRQGDG